MSNNGFPILSLIIFLPIIGSIAIMLIDNVRLAKQLGLVFAILELIASLMVLTLFNSETSEFQLIERHAWIPSLQIEYLIGIDGISVLFLPMSALLTLMVVMASWNAVQQLTCLHLALLLALEGISIGIFLALDMMLFFLFWELTLPLIFLLISLWGIGSMRRSAALKYTLFMLFASVPLLFAIILLAVNHATAMHGSIFENLSFSLPVLLTTTLPDNLQGLVFFLLLLGFAVKTPLIPLHTWLPSVAMEGSTQLIALLVGLKLGAYGIIRFALPLAPQASVQYSWVLGILGAITLVYGALIALQQTNLRRLLAYASISHVGLVVIGIASLNMQGIQGAIFQLLNFTLVASSLMLIAGFIHHRLGSTEIIHLGGLAKVMPKLTCFYFLFALASIGLPGTGGFPAELLLIISTLLSHPSISIAALIGVILSAAYMLSFTRRAFFGPITQDSVRHVQDLRPRELVLLCLSALLVLSFGFFPNSLLKTNQATTEAWLTRLLAQPVMVNNK